MGECRCQGDAGLSSGNGEINSDNVKVRSVMRAVCLYFQIHQPFRLKTYRFFDDGQGYHYYDDYQNRTLFVG
jgi:hypothetical protein